MAWLVFSAPHLLWPLVMSAAPHSSALAAALGLGVFLLLLANYPFWVEVVHESKMPGSSTSGLQLSLCSLWFYVGDFSWAV